MSNWFTSTHPSSRFVSGLIVSTQRPDGTRVALSDWNDLALTIRTPDRTTAAPVERELVPRLLEEQFGLAGFELDAAHRVALRAA
jgi:arylamine N-acetyltransferase